MPGNREVHARADHPFSAHGLAGLHSPQGHSPQGPDGAHGSLSPTATSPTATSPTPGLGLDKMDKMERRLSTSSDASSSASGHNDSHKETTMDYIPTRMTKVSTPKPAANPLQFVKVGPCDLFKQAQETLKKVEEVKKMKKEVRDEAEDWQSNLDNWKCSRRKRVEHIIDRVVEVKKLELEEHERNRRKAKTFSEMMEERTSRGRKMSLLVHKDDESNDLSDLGIGTSSDKSSVSEDYANDDNQSVDDGDVSVKNQFHEQNGSSEPVGKSTNNGQYDETPSNTNILLPEPEEYTYDRAIQGYVNFTETRVKSKSSNHVSRAETESIEEVVEENSTSALSPKQSSAPSPTTRQTSNLEEEIDRLQTMSSEHKSPGKKINLPKVNINKRKELFEKPESSDPNSQSRVAPKAAGDFVNSRSIRDRVSNLERQKSEETIEKSRQMAQLPSELSVKDRLSLLERQQSIPSEAKPCSTSNLSDCVSSSDVAVPAPPSIKARLSSLEQVASQDKTSKTCAEIPQRFIKNRLSELETLKELPKKVAPERDPTFHNKLTSFRSTEQELNQQDVTNSSNNTVADSARYANRGEDEFYHNKAFHRSLDSLDVDSSVLSNEPYERVQSLEDLDSCGPNRNYPSSSSQENLVLSSHSGDTDREDSGIHTADVSCSVSQADEPADFTDVNVPSHNSHGGAYEIERNLDHVPPTIVSQIAKIHVTDTAPKDKVSPHLETVSSETVTSCPLQDLSNSASAINSSVAASKTFSMLQSSLPTILEVSNDCPPMVLISDAESITPTDGTESFSPPSTISCLETLPSLSNLNDSEVRENLTSEALVKPTTAVTPERICMPQCPVDALSLTSRGLTSSAFKDYRALQPNILHSDEDKNLMNVSVKVTTENSDGIPILDMDKGRKPTSISNNLIEPTSPTERKLSSVTSCETDLDVSSFIDQALMEEDLKMDAPSSNGNVLIQERSHEGLGNQPLLQSVTKSNVCPVVQPNNVNVLPLAFSLGSSTTAEPPKEKPPPPPVDLSDDEEVKPNINSSDIQSSKIDKPNLGRLDSTKRIKKDIRRKRSDFLGIEGSNDDSYLECELKVAPPPDMTSFLQEERRLEQELYRQMQPTLYPESDHGSNQGESRDSGVELDNHLHSHNHHSDYVHGDHSSENHSRQNSELFGNLNSTPEEDEIIKKEREIIEILEKEEQWRYGTNTVLSPSDHHQVGEKLAAKLRELEQEKLRLEWERAEELRKVAARQEEERQLRVKEQHLRLQESNNDRLPADVPFNCDPSDMHLEALQEEREQLKREQAELDRQRQILAANQVNTCQSWDSSSSTRSSSHRSLQDVSGPHLMGSSNHLNVPANNSPLNYRLSLPDLQQSDLAVHSMSVHHHRPPPPIPPAKPLSAVDQDRHIVNGLSRHGQLQSSSDSIPMMESYHRHSIGLPSVPIATSPTSSTGSQQMTRQTLHALSAAPRSKIIATDTWVQAKRKPESQRNNNRDNYQHWLIQEAEQRRITEQHQRNAVSRKSLPPTLSQSQLQSKQTPLSAQQAWQYQHSSHQHNMHQMPHQHHHPHHPHPHPQHPHLPVQTTPLVPPPRQEKPLPDAIIQTLTQRVQNRASMNENNRRLESSPARESRPSNQITTNNINNNNQSNMSISHSHTNGNYAANTQEKMLSVSGKKKCSHCNEELGRGAAMIIESLRLFYHMDCFKCCVCHVQLGDGLMGTDVRVRNHKLHCHNCYSSDDGVKFSCV